MASTLASLRPTSASIPPLLEDVKPLVGSATTAMQQCLGVLKAWGVRKRAIFTRTLGM